MEKAKVPRKWERADFRAENYLKRKGTEPAKKRGENKKSAKVNKNIQTAITLQGGVPPTRPSRMAPVGEGVTPTRAGKGKGLGTKNMFQKRNFETGKKNPRKSPKNRAF